MKYPTQNELPLNRVADATPEEAQHWYETELKWWGDRQLGFVAIATLVQLSALGFMLMSFYLINKIF